MHESLWNKSDKLPNQELKEKIFDDINFIISRLDMIQEASQSTNKNYTNEDIFRWIRHIKGVLKGE